MGLCFLFLTLTHASSGESLLGAAEAELPAHDAGRLQAPAVVTHCPPLVVLQHLHPALAQPGSALQPHVSLDKKHTVKLYFSQRGDMLTEG